MAPEATRVYFELGKKKVFACAFDWPGWARSAKTEDAALKALANYAWRFEPVAKRAGITPPTAVRLQVIGRVEGDVTTDFGAPGQSVDADLAPLAAKEPLRIASLVTACWEIFDDVVEVTPPCLRKGPRGGGRDRDAMVEHILAAETMYARKLGIRSKQPAHGDDKAIAEQRSRITCVISSASTPNALVEKGWPVRYAARRIAWHVLDHAWEMEDRRG